MQKAMNFRCFYKFSNFFFVCAVLHFFIGFHHHHHKHGNGVFCEESEKNIIEAVYVSTDGEYENNNEGEYTQVESTDMSKCYDDTECEKGYICSKETNTCQFIQVCDLISGRSHGLRHGECIPCTSDYECGWQPERTTMMNAGIKSVVPIDKNEPESDNNNNNNNKNAGVGNHNNKENKMYYTSTTSTRMDHCWPDGGCRQTEPFRLITFKVTKNSDIMREPEIINNGPPGYSVVPARKFSKGERMCVTIAPNIEESKASWLSIDIMKLEMCASNAYFEGLGKGETRLKSSSHINQRQETLKREIEQQQNQLHHYQRKPDFFYPGIVHYDPAKPSTTGCRTDNNRVRKYTVFTKSEKNLNDMKDHTKHKKNELFTIISMDDNHHFHPSTEISTITSGGDTVCFDAIPITAKDVPIYVEATIRVSPGSGDSQRNQSSSQQPASIQDQKLMLEMLYGIHNGNVGINKEDTFQGKEDESNRHGKGFKVASNVYWQGIVASDKFKRNVPQSLNEYNGGAGGGDSTLYGYYHHHVEYEDYEHDDDDDGNGIFVNCDTGTKFNGVAGICEAPTIANQVFFWVLIANTLVIIGGSILFVLALRKHNDDILYLVRNGFIDTD